MNFVVSNMKYNSTTFVKETLVHDKGVMKTRRSSSVASTTSLCSFSLFSLSHIPSPSFNFILILTSFVLPETSFIHFEIRVYFICYLNRSEVLPKVRLKCVVNTSSNLVQSVPPLWGKSTGPDWLRVWFLDQKVGPYYGSSQE